MGHPHGIHLRLLKKFLTELLCEFQFHLLNDGSIIIDEPKPHQVLEISDIITASSFVVIPALWQTNFSVAMNYNGEAAIIFLFFMLHLT